MKHKGKIKDKILKFFKHLKNRDFFRGAAMIIWKVEDGKKYILLSKRAHGYGKGNYGDTGGHRDEVDFVDGKWDPLLTAIRESGEETSKIRQFHSYDHAPLSEKLVELNKAKAFFLNNPDFNITKIRHINVHFYNNYTYSCLVTGKMASDKWFNESWESKNDTMKWYALDQIPKPILFACWVNVLYVRKQKIIKQKN